jgi:O-antigen ligase
MDRLIFWALGSILILLPLPYGSVEPWSIYIFEAAVFVLFILHIAGRTFSGKTAALVEPLTISPPPERGSRADGHSSRRGRSVPFVWRVLPLIFFAVLIVQLIPLPPSFVKILSPAAFAIRSAPGSWMPLSLSPALSSSNLIQSIAYLLFAYLVFTCIRTRRQAEIFVWAVLAAGLFQAVYGLAEYWGGTGRIFGWININGQGSAFGTFVNRDHFSGFLEMAFPLSVGYLLAKADFFTIRAGLSFKEKILRFAEERLQKTLILGLFTVLLGLGILFSRCRSGVIILLVTLFLMILIASASDAGKKRRGAPARHGESRSPRIVRTVAIAVLFLALIIGIDPVLARFTKESVSFEEGRAVFYKNTLDLINRFFIAGSGGGTFVRAYPLVQKVDELTVLTHAHNDYLEVLAETGIIGGGALILAAIGVFLHAGRRWFERRDPLVRGIALGALAGVLALLIHSFLDFNLRIPANAALFFALLALALRTLRLPSQD